MPVAGIAASNAKLVFGKPQGLLPLLLPKLVRSYAHDTLEDEGSVSGDKAPEFGRYGPLSRLSRGHDLQLTGGGLVGGALVAHGALVHRSVWSSAYE